MNERTEYKGYKGGDQIKREVCRDAKDFVMKLPKDKFSELVEILKQAWKEGELKAGDDAINAVLAWETKDNDKLSKAIAIVAVINGIYSTFVKNKDYVAMAQRLAGRDFEPSSVEDLCANKEGGAQYYSFATKYMSFKYPDSYPIYDSYLQNFVKGREKICLDGYGRYEEYKSRIGTIRNKLDPENKLFANYKEFDQVMWLLLKLLCKYDIQFNENTIVYQVKEALDLY
ncbi:MAG: hypothetical protein HUJ83_11025 [Veillonella sp.]|nr:hypothetical protein [Veillonella sp.]